MPLGPLSRGMEVSQRNVSVLVLGVAVASLGVSAGCSTAPSRASGSADTTAEAARLTRLDDEWSASAAARNVDQVASFYAEDAIAFPPNEPTSMGKSAARMVWAAYLADPSFTISWKTTHAEVARSGEIGYTSGTYQDSFKGPDGTMVHEVGKYLCVWKKQSDGTWKAIRDMWNTDSK